MGWVMTFWDRVFGDGGGDNRKHGTWVSACVWNLGPPSPHPTLFQPLLLLVALPTPGSPRCTAGPCGYFTGTKKVSHLMCPSGGSGNWVTALTLHLLT